MAQFKKIKGKVFGVSLSKEEQRAMNAEINRQIAENYKEWLVNLDAMVLWTLHTYLGFGEKRLKQFYKEFTKQHIELMQYYECDGDDGRLCIHKLKGIGIDLKAWAKELEEEVEDDSSKLS